MNSSSSNFTFSFTFFCLIKSATMSDRHVHVTMVTL